MSGSTMNVICFGVDAFRSAFENSGVTFTHLDRRPPVDGSLEPVNLRYL